MAGMAEDTVLVLHQIGSHGPAYHLRYPKDREEFTPACHSAEFAECTGAEIVNAYDNSILYTDHVLASLIDLLAGQDKVIPALLYVSDHGESLGENGLFLHGAPYFMAPATQTQVPMVMWLSKAYTAAFGVDTACLRTEAAQPASHDNLFSSVLGLMDIGTSAKGVGADLISACRNAAS
jgi:lipid A ethanolaminephosphotransferase